MMELTKLFKHDNTIRSVEISISENYLQFIVGQFGANSIARIRINNPDHFSIENSRPWGASNSINEVVLNENNLIIELQSGDYIKISKVLDYEFEVINEG